MSAERKPAMSSGEETVRQSISDVKALMGRMGARSFDPLPPTQHQWQRAKGWPDVLRLWSWMCAHTIHWGHRCEYAVDHEGNELHLENIAEGLKIDIANVYRAWNKGVTLTLWRNGNPKEGKRRLYLVGQVDLTKAESESSAEDPKIVCTDNLPGYIVNKIKELDPERRAQFTTRYLALEKAERGAMAEAVAAVRDIFAHEKDNTFATFGLEKRRLEPKKNNGNGNGHGIQSVSSSDAPGAGIEAPANVRPIATACHAAILPLVELYVQTIQNPVQTQEKALYVAAAEACTADASLLGQKLPEKSQRREASGRDMGSSGPVKSSPLEGQSVLNQQYAGEGQSPLTQEDQEALALFFEKTREIQTSFKHTRFGEDLINPENKGDQTLARKILAEVGAGEMAGFCYQLAIDFGIADKNSLGKLPRPKFYPARNPHERYIGLIYERATDWKRGAAERAEHARLDREASARRKQMVERAEREALEQEESWANAEQEFAGMSEAARADLLRSVEADLKADPMAARLRGVHRAEAVEMIAKRRLRDQHKGGAA